MSLVSLPAPDFTAKAVMADGLINEKFNLLDYIRGKNAVLFFYPLDFTFVCPSEILSFNDKVEEFEKENTLLIGISVDSHFTHCAWRDTDVNQGGIGAIKFPLVSDLSKVVARKYDVLLNEEVALRGLFVIDKNSIVRVAAHNDLSIGRSVDEALRLVQSVNFVDQNEGREVCPANWRPNAPSMKPTKEGVAQYLKDNRS